MLVTKADTTTPETCAAVADEVAAWCAGEGGLETLAISAVRGDNLDRLRHLLRRLRETAAHRMEQEPDDLP